jgi:hypothetical protein
MIGLFVPWGSIKTHLEELKTKLDSEANNNESHHTDRSNSIPPLTFGTLFHHILPSLKLRVQFHIQNFQHLKKSSEDVKAEQRFRQECTDYSDSHLDAFDHSLSNVENSHPQDEHQDSEEDTWNIHDSDKNLALEETRAALGMIKDLTQFEMSGEKMFKHLLLQRCYSDTDLNSDNNDLPDLDVDHVQRSSSLDTSIPHFRRWIDSQNKRLAKLHPSEEINQQTLDDDTADIEVQDSSIVNQEQVDVALGLSPPCKIRQCGQDVAQELNLNKKQRQFLDLVVHGLTVPESSAVPQGLGAGSNTERSFLSLQFASKPLCIYLGGEGGTGKSVAIKAVQLLMEKLLKRTWLQICATTGSAADNIGGTTYHSALNVTWGGQSFKATASQMAKWHDKRILIVDEVSMLSTCSLGALEMACRASKGICSCPWPVFFCPHSTAKSN